MRGRRGRRSRTNQINILDTMAKKNQSKSTTGTSDPIICLELVWPGAKAVHVAGSFNEWHPGATPMIEVGQGVWKKEIMLKPGYYEYRFVVDGTWVDDPNASEWIPNEFGAANAVLRVEAATEPAPVEPKPSKLKTKRAKA